MNCELIRKKLNAYTDAELPEETTNEIAIHLEKCEDCSRALTRLQGLTTILGEISIPDVPKDLADRVLAHVYERSKGMPSMQSKHESVFLSWNPRFLAARMAATAAVLVMGLAIGALMGRDTWRGPDMQSGGKLEMAQVEPTATYNLDYLTGAPKGSPAAAYLMLVSATNGRER